jgi:hypothetical protein
MAAVAARSATAKIVIEQMRGAIKSRLVRLAGVVLRAGSDVRLTRGIRRWKRQKSIFTHLSVFQKCLKRLIFLPPLNIVAYRCLSTYIGHALDIRPLQGR